MLGSSEGGIQAAGGFRLLISRYEKPDKLPWITGEGRCHLESPLKMGGGAVLAQILLQVACGTHTTTSVFHSGSSCSLQPENLPSTPKATPQPAPSKSNVSHGQGFGGTPYTSQAQEGLGFLPRALAAPWESLVLSNKEPSEAPLSR